MAAHHQMGQASYNRLGRRRRRMRGFRLSSLRLSILRLRVKFFSFLNLFVDCMEEHKCSQVVRSTGTARSPCERTGGRRAPVSKARHERPRGQSRQSSSLERESSYYAEAIADCLEFIKRSSLPKA